MRIALRGGGGVDGWFPWLRECPLVVMFVSLGTHRLDCAYESAKRQARGDKMHYLQKKIRNRNRKLIRAPSSWIFKLCECGRFRHVSGEALELCTKLVHISVIDSVLVPTFI